MTASFRAYAATLSAVAIIFFLSLGQSGAETFVPTAIGGSLSYGYGYSRVDTGESEQTSLVLTLNGAGYFWEPWFLTTSAGLSFGLGESDSNTGAGTIAKTVGGSIDMTLFPESRFPTSMGYSLTDSRQDVQEQVVIHGQDYRVQRFYLRQSYNAPNGANYGAWYNQGSVTVSGQSSESVDRNFGFQVRKRQSYHDFNFITNYFDDRPALSDVKSASLNMMFSHTYFPSAEVGVNSIASYSNSKTTSSSSPDFEFVYDQVSSSFYWRPEHRPYYISGGVRLFETTSGTSSRGVSTSANASYRFTRNINFGAGVSVNVADADGQQSLDTTQTISGSFFSDQYTIIGFDYGWNGAVGVSNSLSRSDSAPLGNGDPKSVQTVNANLGHRLSRGWNLGRSASMSLAFGQGGGASRASTSDLVSSSFSNSVSLGWNHSGFGGSTSANATASDSRSFGEYDSAFQVVSAQFGRSQELSRLSTLTGSLNVQASRATQSNAATTAEDNGAITRTGSAAFTYMHARFFGIYNLVYNSSLVFPSLLGNNVANTQSTAEWDNTFTYRVGLLSLNLLGRVTENGPGQRAYSLTFQAIRTF